MQFLISVSTPTPIGTQHDDSWQNQLISCDVYIKVSVKFQAKAHQTLYTTLRYFQNCYCHLCPLITLMQFRPTHTILPYTGRSHMHGDSRLVMINSRSLVYTSPPASPSDLYRITTDTYMYNKQNPMSILRFYMHVPKLKEVPITRKNNGYKETLLILFRRELI